MGRGFPLLSRVVENGHQHMEAMSGPSSLLCQSTTLSKKVRTLFCTLSVPHSTADHTAAHERTE